MINYYLITKPGIILGNLITLAAGFWLASKGAFDLWLFMTTLVGLAFIMASACVFNNYIDSPLDKKMKRTKHRPLVTGLISGRQALFFASFLGLIGFTLLFFYTNLLTLLVAAAGFFVYVILYSFWKGRTIYGTAIGSVAGAVPPVVGYCAVSNSFDLAAFLLFMMMVLWQMPHFFSIALYHFDDYVAANIPVLPVKKGVLRTKIHMLVYIVGFLFVASLFTFYGYTGYLFLVVAMSFGLSWLLLCIKGFTIHNQQLWGRQMFWLSLLLITATSFIIPFDR